MNWPSIWKPFTQVVGSVAVFTVLFMAVTSCSHRDDQSSQRPTSAQATLDRPASAYPLFSSRWDSVDNLEGVRLEPAKFAAETEVLNEEFALANQFDANLMNRYNERVSPTYVATKMDWANAGGKGAGATGGTLWRVVDAQPVADGYRVTLCEFDTPGQYNVIDGQPIHDPRNARSLAADNVVVSRTMKPSATDQKAEAPSPRLLVTSISNAVGDNESPGVLCDKFAPDPFIQSPPSPLPTPSGGK